MVEVRLSMEDWNRVLAILSQAPWAQVNPLMMQIGQQLQAQKPDGPDLSEAVNRVRRPPPSDA